MGHIKHLDATWARWNTKKQRQREWACVHCRSGSSDKADSVYVCPIWNRFSHNRNSPPHPGWTLKAQPLYRETPVSLRSAHLFSSHFSFSVAALHGFSFNYESEKQAHQFQQLHEEQRENGRLWLQQFKWDLPGSICPELQHQLGLSGASHCQCLRQQEPAGAPQLGDRPQHPNGPHPGEGPDQVAEQPLRQLHWQGTVVSCSQRTFKPKK